MTEFDRTKMEYPSVRTRKSKINIIEVSEEPALSDLSRYDPALVAYTEKIAGEIREAKKSGASVICAFGAHSLKNGLGRLIGSLLQQGWITHAATNGAGIIHDWEFSYLGMSSEDVRKNVKIGRFGTWNETGKYISLALAAGAYEGYGYAEAVGKLVMNDGIQIPSVEELEKIACDRCVPPWKRAAALDYASVLRLSEVKEGFLHVEHPYKKYSIHFYLKNSQGLFTCHPMIGHDIIYTHFANSGACVGRTAEHDFLRYASSVSHLNCGVYLSIGSAVMSPMIFEKSLSMARNVSLQEGEPLENFNIHVVDLQKSSWDWSRGEPPMDDPAYYLRYMKTFNRMGGKADYYTADNRDLLNVLYTLLNS